VASDATFDWNGGTASASDPTNWTLEGGGVANTPNIPQSDDSIVMASGDAQFTDMPLPGQDNGTQGATVFWSGGQIDMINSGGTAGTAGILANTLVTITASVSLTSTGAATNNGTIDSDTGGNLAFTVLSGTFTNTGTLEALNGGAVQISTDSGATFVNSGSVIADNGGSVLISGSLDPTNGYWSMGTTGGGTIEVNAPVTSADIVFDFPSSGLLKLDQIATFGGDIKEPGGGDTIDVGPVNVATIVVATTGAGDGTINLTLEDSGAAALGSFFVTPFTGDSFQTGTFAVAGDGSAGPNFNFAAVGGDDTMTVNTSAVACFLEGTVISTEHGEVPVEELVVGQCVHAVVGGKPAPIIWIGHRTIDCSRHPQPKQVWPVRISAGAFGRGKPSRDLYLSPDHAVYVEDVLIPVKYLINGSSIVQVPRAKVTYYHVELPQHDVVLANGMHAESYLAGADRTIFANNGGPISLYPDLSSRVWEAEGCAPLVITGPAFQAARQRIRLPGRTVRTRTRSKAA
jgi:hypothetical protein